MHNKKEHSRGFPSNLYGSKHPRDEYPETCTLSSEGISELHWIISTVLNGAQLIYRRIKMNSWWNTSNSWFLFLGSFVFGCSPHQLGSDKNKLAFKCCCGGAFSAVRTTKTGLGKKLGGAASHCWTGTVLEARWLKARNLTSDYPAFNKRSKLNLTLTVIYSMNTFHSPFSDRH